MVPWPLNEDCFYHFGILLILVQNVKSAKNLQVQNFMVYSNKYLSFFNQ